MKLSQDEVELEILKRYVAQYKRALMDDPDNKSARELDFRDVVRDVTGLEGRELDYEAARLFQRLASRKMQDGLTPLRQSGDRSRPRHARAYLLKGREPAWERTRELEEKVARSRPPDEPREREQKFGILWSVGQAAVDFGAWVESSKDLPAALLFLDVDNFKSFNSNFTEATIDKTLLPEFQRLLEQMVEPRGHAYRHGGEEFLVLLTNHTLDEAEAFAERLRAAIAAHKFEVDGKPVSVTVSIGVAGFPEHGAEYDSVLERANQVKKDAKSAGRNRVVRAS